MAQPPEAVDVLIVDLARGLGGAEKRVLQLAAGLPKHGADVEVACLSGGPLEQRLLEQGSRYFPVPYGRGDPRTAAALARYLKGRCPCIVDAHNVQSLWWTILASMIARGRTTRIATVHSEYRYSEGNLRLKGILYEAVLRTACRSDWNFVAVSDSVDRYLMGIGVDVARRTTVWSAVQPPALPTPGRLAALRHDLGFTSDDFVVACVGRLVPAKDHATLLTGLAAVQHSVPNVRLLLIGDGPLDRHLRAMVAALGLDNSVTFLGHRDDVDELLAMSNLFALTSRIEGLPYALLEAAAVGTPILATRVGAIPYVFNDKSALLLDPGDPKSVAAALRDAATNADKLALRAARAVETIDEAGGIDAMIRSTLTAYGCKEF